MDKVSLIIKMFIRIKDSGKTDYLKEMLFKDVINKVPATLVHLIVVLNKEKAHIHGIMVVVNIQGNSIED
jgi:hypothetical protein